MKDQLSGTACNPFWKTVGGGEFKRSGDYSSRGFRRARRTNRFLIRLKQIT